MNHHDAFFLCILLLFCAGAHYGARHIAEAIYRYRAFNRVVGYSRVRPAIYKDWWVK